MWETNLLYYFRNGVLAFKTSLFSLHTLSHLSSPQLDPPKQQFARFGSIGREGAFRLLLVMAMATTTAGFSSNAEHWSVLAGKASHQTVECQSIRDHKENPVPSHFPLLQKNSGLASVIGLKAELKQGAVPWGHGAI